MLFRSLVTEVGDTKQRKMVYAPVNVAVVLADQAGSDEVSVRSAQRVD